MKQIFVVYMALFAISMFSSCSNNEEFSVNSTSNNPCETVGKLHNEGLNYIWGHYTRNANFENISQEELEPLCVQFMEEITQNGEILDISEYYQANIEEEVHEAYIDAIAIAQNSGEVEAAALEEEISNLDVDLTVKEEIRNIFSNYDLMSDMLFANYIDNKEMEICFSDNIDQVDKAMILSVIAIAKYSSSYWTTPTNGMSKKRIVKSDIRGAVRGLWRGRFVIVFCTGVGGAGCGAAAAMRYALKGALLSSAVCGLLEFISDDLENGEGNQYGGESVPDDGPVLLIP